MLSVNVNCVVPVILHLLWHASITLTLLPCTNGDRHGELGLPWQPDVVREPPVSSTVVYSYNRLLWMLYRENLNSGTDYIIHTYSYQTAVPLKKIPLKYFSAFTWQTKVNIIWLSGKRVPMWNDSHILSCCDMKRNGPHKYPSIQYDGNLWNTPQDWWGSCNKWRGVDQYICPWKLSRYCNYVGTILCIEKKDPFPIYRYYHVFITGFCVTKKCL